MTNLTMVAKVNALRTAVESVTWTDMSADERAEFVLDYLKAKDVRSSSLAAAMGQMPYWNQGPSDYLHMAMALRAAHEARGWSKTA